MFESDKTELFAKSDNQIAYEMAQLLGSTSDEHKFLLLFKRCQHAVQFSATTEPLTKKTQKSNPQHVILKVEGT